MSDIRQEWLTLQRAEELFCIPVPTWRRWLREGRLGFSRLGGRILIRRADVEAWIARNFHPGRSEAGAASRGRTRHAARETETVLDPESILATLEGGTGLVTPTGA